MEIEFINAGELAHYVCVNLESEEMRHALACIGETPKVRAQFLVDPVAQRLARDTGPICHLGQVANDIFDGLNQFTAIVFENRIRFCPGAVLLFSDCDTCHCGESGNTEHRPVDVLDIERSRVCAQQESAGYQEVRGIFHLAPLSRREDVTNRIADADKRLADNKTCGDWNADMVAPVLTFEAVCQLTPESAQ